MKYRVALITVFFIFFNQIATADVYDECGAVFSVSFSTKTEVFNENSGPVNKLSQLIADLDINPDFYKVLIDNTFIIEVSPDSPAAYAELRSKISRLAQQEQTPTFEHNQQISELSPVMKKSLARRYASEVSCAASGCAWVVAGVSPLILLSLWLSKVPLPSFIEHFAMIYGMAWPYSPILSMASVGIGMMDFQQYMKKLKTLKDQDESRPATILANQKPLINAIRKQIAAQDDNSRINIIYFISNGSNKVTNNLYQNRYKLWQVPSEKFKKLLQSLQAEK